MIGAETEGKVCFSVAFGVEITLLVNIVMAIMENEGICIT